MDNTKSASNGVGFCGLLAIAFIVLKLCNVINWSWLWVLSPLWMPAVIAIIIFVFFVLIKLPEIRAKARADKAIKEIMERSGKSYRFAREEYLTSIGEEIPKSKWQQRYDEMMESQKRLEAIRSSQKDKP